MKKSYLVAGLLAASLALPLTACGGSQASAPADSSAAPAAEAKGSFDANSYYVGQWRGAVEITGTTVYGTAGGTEQMLDVIFSDDGFVEVKPLEKHADLLSDKGTWEGDESKVTLHLSKGDVVLNVTDKATLTGKAADFGIKDFDEISFDFYG